MSQFVSTTIEAGGKEIRQFCTLNVSQAIDSHHSFCLVCPAEAVDHSGPTLHLSKNLIGAEIKIKIAAVNSLGAMQFAGVITQVEAAHYSGHTGDVIVSGFAPTILLDGGAHSKSWEKQTLGSIFGDVLHHFPANLLKSKLNPLSCDTLLYTVQYKETAWEFLRRLGAEHGEWLFYDGESLVLGSPKGSKIKLLYGSNLSYFNMVLRAMPTGFQMVSHDYINQVVYSASPSDLAGKAGLDELGKHTLQKSESFYTTRPKQLYNRFLDSKEPLEKHACMLASMQSGNLVRFQGSSGHPGVQVGGPVSVTGNNVLSGKEEIFGDYTIIAVNHTCDGQGNYTNDFTAIPRSVRMPPDADRARPHCETQSALVTDNYDELGLGRVRVRFHWMATTEKTPWLRIAGAHGGNGKGVFFIPEVGEEVMVGFESDDAIKPFVIGTLYNGKAKTGFGNKNNDVKAIQTRSGSKIILNDQEGSIHISDAKGNDMLIDGKGNVQVTSSETMVFTCGAARIEMKRDGTININGKIVTVSASEKAAMVSGDASFAADGKGNKADMAAATSTVKGKTSVTVDAGTKTTVSAGTKVDVKGAIIALN